MELILGGRRQAKHLTESPPDLEDPCYNTRNEEEAILYMSLSSTMTLDVYSNYLFMPTVKKLWDEVHVS